MKLSQNNEIKIVAFDFFDTIVHRTCHPEENLYKWARYLSQYLNYSIDAMTIYNTRKKCEYVLKRNIEESRYDRLLGAVFNDISTKFSLSVSEDEFLKHAKKLEYEIELNSMYLNKEIVPFLNEARKSEKKMIIISDFYCGKDLFLAALKMLKVDHYFSEIYISSEFGKRKSTGNLFKKVLLEEHADAREIFMIGDNPKSDFDVPKSLGINVHHLSFVEKHEVIKTKQLFKKIKHLSFEENKNAVFNGYLSSVYFFIEKLYQSLVKQNINEISFCSREGQLLKKMFDLYQSSNIVDGHQISTHYFYTSRKATLVASLQNVESEKFDGIFRQYHQILLSDFLSSLSFSKKEQENIYELTGLNSGTIMDRLGSELELLKQNSFFREQYDNKRHKQKKLLTSYIKSLCSSEDRFVIVDIGWKGTMQNNLVNILRGTGIDVFGFYFGLENKGAKKDSSKEGIVFSRNLEKSKNYRFFHKNYMIYERIFVADHGPVSGYKMTSGEVRPIISQDTGDLELYRYVLNYQRLFVDGFKELLLIMEKSLYRLVDLERIAAMEILIQDCIVYPRLWRVEQQQRQKTKENFGDISSSLRKSKKKTIQKKLEKKDFLFVDYAYKIPQSVLKSGLLNPLSSLYCYFVYSINRILLK